MEWENDGKRNDERATYAELRFKVRHMVARTTVRLDHMHDF
jgi:hypothetical protein